MVSVRPNQGGVQVTVKKGEHAEFICAATGVGRNNFKYQWFLNKDFVAGQSASTLIINSVSEGNTGDYSCSVQNQYGGIGRSNNTATLILGEYMNGY